MENGRHKCWASEHLHKIDFDIIDGQLYMEYPSDCNKDSSHDCENRIRVGRCPFCGFQVESDEQLAQDGLI